MGIFWGHTYGEKRFKKNEYVYFYKTNCASLCDKIIGGEAVLLPRTFLHSARIYVQLVLYYSSLTVQTALTDQLYISS